MTSQAANLRGIASRHAEGTELAIVSWIGYEPPNQNGPDHTPIENNTTALLDGRSTEISRSAGRDMASFTDGIDASHATGDYRLTMAGHSYGSTTTASALRYLYEDGRTPVDATVVYGSPGLSEHDNDETLIQTTEGPMYRKTPELSDMGLSRDSSFYLCANGDNIPLTTFVSDHGPLPERWGMTRLATGTATVKNYDYAAAPEHADYTRQHNGRDRTTMLSLVDVALGEERLMVRE